MTGLVEAKSLTRFLQSQSMSSRRTTEKVPLFKAESSYVNLDELFSLSVFNFIIALTCLNQTKVPL